MPMGSKVAVIGAGSLRCGAAVLASLFSLPLEPDAHLALCDLHDEALDLFDRLARSLAAAHDIQPAITATNYLSEALESADVVILAFGLGREATDLAQWCAPETHSLARAVLLNRTFESVNEELFANKPESVVNLVAPIGHSQQLLAYSAVHLDWPPPLADEERVPAAHQALRWVRAEDNLYSLLNDNKDSPVVKAVLDQSPAPANKFNPKALAGWISELGKIDPGCLKSLLR